MSTYAAYVVDTIPELVNPQVSGRNEATVLGYNKKGDGGGGTFYWQTGSFTGNSGTIFPKAAVGSNPGGAWIRVVDSPVSVKWFGAIGDGVTDDTTPIRSAIIYIAGTQPTSSASGNEIPSRNFSQIAHVLRFPTAKYKVNGVLYLPSGVILDGEHSTLVGKGTSTDYWKTGGTLFESGYINSSGTLVSNIGTAVESERVVYSEVKNFVIQYYGIAFNLYNCNEATRFENLLFSDCYQAMIMNRCFFSYLNNCYSRTSLASNYLTGFDQAAFVFNNASNIITVNDMSAAGRNIGYQFEGPINSMIITNLDAENVNIGILFKGTSTNSDAVNPLTITSCYFENVYTSALKFDTFTVNNLEVFGNWFLNCTACCTFTNTALYNGKISAYNTFNSSPFIVKLDAFTQQYSVNFVVEPYTLSVPTLDAPPSFQDGTLPSGYSSLSPNINLEGYKTVYSSTGTKDVAFRGEYAPYNYVVPKYYTGRSGYVAGVIPYCTWEVTNINATTHVFDAIIHTDIYYDAGMSVFFNFTLGDYNYAYTFRGKVLNGDLLLEGMPAKKIDIAQTSSKLDFKISGLYHPQNVFSKSGTIQIL